MSKPMKPAREFWVDRNNFHAYDKLYDYELLGFFHVIEISAIQALTEQVKKALDHEVYLTNKMVELESQLAAKDSAITKLRSALEKTKDVVGQWHGKEAFDIYVNHSPEMNPYRQALKETSGV